MATSQPHKQTAAQRHSNVEFYDISELERRILGGLGGAPSDSEAEATAAAQTDLSMAQPPAVVPPPCSEHAQAYAFQPSSEHPAIAEEAAAAAAAAAVPSPSTDPPPAAAAPTAEGQERLAMGDAFIAALVNELAGGQPAPEFGCLGCLGAAHVVAQLGRDGTHDAALVNAAAECIPGLVAALGSEKQLVRAAALTLLSRASRSEANSWAIAAAGGADAVSQLVLAHSSDANMLSHARTVFHGLMRVPQLRQAAVSGGGIAALAHGLRAAGSDGSSLGWLIPLVSLAIHNPSHSCTTQLLATGLASDVLRQLAIFGSPCGSTVATTFWTPLLCSTAGQPLGSTEATTFLNIVAEQHGWLAALAMAQQAAESLLQTPLDTPLLASSCRALAATFEDVCKRGEQARRLSSMYRRGLQGLASRLKRKAAVAGPPPAPPAPPDPAQLAAAESAAEAAAAALLEEEEQAGAQQAAKAAAKAAKRQRQKERRQATEAEAAASDTSAAASHAATAEVGAPAKGGEGAAPAAAPPAVLHADQAAAEEAQPEAPLSGGAGTSGSSSAAAGASAGQGRRRQRKKKDRGAVAGSAAAQEAAAGQVGNRAEAGQQASAAEGSPCDPAEPDAAELEQLMQQLGLGPAATAVEGSPAGGAAEAAAEGLHAAGAACVTPHPATPAPPPAGGRASAAAATAPTLPLDPSLLSDLCCPITHEPMADPVVAADGTTYERAAIEGWIARQRAAGQAPTSPLTGAPLQDLSLHPNLIVRGLGASLRAAGLLQ